MIIGVLASIAALALVPSADAHSPTKTCATFHSQHLRWRSYKTGKVTCGAATAVLDAVLHGAGQFHKGRAFEDNYVLYHGWKCPQQQMGAEDCWRPPHDSYFHATATITAISCANAGGCPAHLA